MEKIKIMDELTIDNILTTEEMDNIFDVDFVPPSNGEDKTPEEKEKEKETAEVNPEELFPESPEIVGSGNTDNQGKENASTQEKSNTSPNPDVYSSIATTLKEEGILSALDDESLKEIVGAEGLVKALEKQVQSQLDERQRRINEALDYGVNPTEIQKYERTVQYLEDITVDSIKDETNKGEQLRRQLIYQDFVNRGMNEERAKKQMERSISLGTDVEDALEALESNKEFFQDSYKNLLEDAKTNDEKEQKVKKDQAEKLKKSILETEEPFEGLKLDANTRQRVLDNISKPVYKDTEGNWFTPIQKYEMENREDFIKKLGVIFTLTDGFKNLDKIVKQKVQRETKRSLTTLEHALNNTARNSDGTLAFMSGVSGDENSRDSFVLDI